MNENKKINCLIYLISIYITLKILIFTLGDKTLIYSHHYVSIGSLFIPLWFFVGDILTEIYGFPLIRKILFIALTCQLVFSLICFSTAFIPANNLDNINNAYNLVFLRMPRLAFSSLISLVSGALINYYLLAKWKKIVHGKYFLIRSLCTTITGEVLFSIIAITSQFFGKTTSTHLMEIMTASITIKLIMTVIFAYPISLLANYMQLSIDLKRETVPPHPLQLIDRSV
jgi:uncharacterized integral membrane protein (TIGR00697 family)